MDIFSQKKMLLRLVVVLALLNVALIVFFAFKGERYDERKRGYRDVSGILEKELELNKKQVRQIDSLRAGFLQSEKVLAKTIRAERDSMNQLMFNKNTNDTLVLALARRVAENDYKMELLRIEQAKSFKSICTPAQRDKFEGLVKEIRDYFRPDNQPKK